MVRQRHPPATDNPPWADILRRRDGLDYSSFAGGRDGGIDLRASTVKGEKVIVQAKRYKTWAELKSILKKEADKVKKLKPNRYVFATSVDLSAGNAQEIKEMFNPYIKNDNDVLGKQDFNKYLGDYKDIEMTYYKLWLTSSDVMKNFLHKHIVNKSEFAIADMKETVRTFVMNPSFDKAFKTLLKYHYVILSGMPGVGKTTLARMLSYVLLSKKYPELKYDKFYFISSKLEDAYEMFQNGEREIFFFDDFLGSTRFQKDDEKNFDTDLITFIDHVRRDDDKLFILTTREYILKDALNYYEKLESSGIEIAKCIVDVGKYSDYVKGQILYNHLSDSGLKHGYIMAIKQNRNYIKLIRHKNFNPRIIESFIKQAPNETIPPEEYFSKILHYFDNPTSVWQGAYDQLPLTAREMILVLITMGKVVMYNDWRQAFEAFYSMIHSSKGYLDETEWYHSVKLLSDCFIRVDTGKSGMYVSFYNPGIEDFLINYIKQVEGTQLRLTNSSIYIEQLYTIFGDKVTPSTEVVLEHDKSQLVAKDFERCWNDYKSCNTIRHNPKDEESYYSPYSTNKLEALSEFYDSFTDLCHSIPDLITSRITKEMLYNNHMTAWDCLYILNKIDPALLKIDEKELFEYYKDKLPSSLDYKEFAKSLNGILIDYKSYGDTEEFQDGLDSALFENLNSEEASAYSNLDDTVDYISDFIPSWDSTGIREAIQAHNDGVDDYIESMVEDEDYRFYQQDDTGNSEDARIDNLFETLE